MKEGFRVLDSDMHVIEPDDLWEKYLEPEWQAYAPKVSRIRGHRMAIITMDDVVFPDVDVLIEDRGQAYGLTQRADGASAKMRDQGYSAKSQVEAMEIEGLDVAVLFPTNALYVPLGADNVDPRFSAALCRAYNNWLYDFCQEDPQKLKGCAQLPVHDVGEAVREAHRAVKELGFVGCWVRPNPVNGRNWHLRYFDPLWDALQELNVPICFHEGTGAANDQTKERFGANRMMRHACGHPLEAMMVMLSLCAGGVLEAFPELRVAFFEAYSGWVPFWLERMDRNYQAFGEWYAPSLTMKPSEYFLRQCLVGSEADDALLPQVITAIGDSNITFSTDYPHFDSDFPHAVEKFVKRDMSDEAKRKILWDNCAWLYNLAKVPVAAQGSRGS